MLQDAEPPKEPIPEYLMPIQITTFRKEYIKYPEIVKEVGLKALKEQRPHWDEIGKNPSVCRKLFGLGQTLNDLPGFDFSFNEYGNHVWIPQPNLKNNNKIMYVCFNCGSLMLNKKFIPYTDLKK